MGGNITTQKNNKIKNKINENEPFKKININLLANILLIFSDILIKEKELEEKLLYLLFIEARKMGGHNNDLIMKWINDHLEIQITLKESENLVSFIGLFLPFESEMETLEEDFEFVQKRCTLIPPATHLMWEWSAQVKLMEKNVRIARGYTSEKPIQISKHSVSLNYRFGRKTSPKRSAKRICITPGNSNDLLPEPEEAEVEAQEQAQAQEHAHQVEIVSFSQEDEYINRDPSIDAAWDSPRQENYHHKHQINHHSSPQNQQQSQKRYEPSIIPSQPASSSFLSNRSQVYHSHHSSQQQIQQQQQQQQRHNDEESKSYEEMRIDSEILNNRTIRNLDRNTIIRLTNSSNQGVSQTNNLESIEDLNQDHSEVV